MVIVTLGMGGPSILDGILATDNLGGLVGMTLLQKCKGRGFESHQSNMPVIFFTELGKVLSIQC